MLSNIEEVKAIMAEYSLPDYMVGGVSDYIFDRIEPGGFLYALLSNDLKGTFERADSNNINLIKEWLTFLYNYAPMSCWGSEEAVDNWIQGYNND